MDEKISPITDYVEEKTEGIDTTTTEKRQNRYTLGPQMEKSNPARSPFFAAFPSAPTLQVPLSLTGSALTT